MSRALIEVKGLFHTYHPNTPFAREALRGVDLKLESGQVLGLVGPSPSGKSTLLQYLNGLYVPQPDQGKVWVLGQDTAAPDTSLWEIRRRVALLFQQPEQQLFEPTVLRDVALGLRNFGVALEDELEKRVREALERAGLDPERVLRRYSRTLSGGERRRVALACILALEPEVLLLDDPLSGLDPRGRWRLLGVLKSLAERGISMVIASTRLDYLIPLVDSLAVMADGRILAFGSLHEVLNREDVLRAAGLQLPEIWRVQQELRSRGLPLGEPAADPAEAARRIARALGVA